MHTVVTRQGPLVRRRPPAVSTTLRLPAAARRTSARGLLSRIGAVVVISAAAWAAVSLLSQWSGESAANADTVKDRLSPSTIVPASQDTSGRTVTQPSVADTRHHRSIAPAERSFASPAPVDVPVVDRAAVERQRAARPDHRPVPADFRRGAGPIMATPHRPHFSAPTWPAFPHRSDLKPPRFDMPGFEMPTRPADLLPVEITPAPATGGSNSSPRVPADAMATHGSSDTAIGRTAGTRQITQSLAPRSAQRAVPAETAYKTLGANLADTSSGVLAGTSGPSAVSAIGIAVSARDAAFDSIGAPVATGSGSWRARNDALEISVSPD